MSSWQAFFNQLSRPVNKEILPISNKICQCSKGTLLFRRTKNYISTYEPLDGCSLRSVCCAIQIDKHRAYSS